MTNISLGIKAFNALNSFKFTHFIRTNAVWYNKTIEDPYSYWSALILIIYSALGSNEINEDIKSTVDENQLEDVPVEELDAPDIED